MTQTYPTLRVAAAQLASGGNMDENQSRIQEAMRRAAALGAEVVLFPETALTGYSPTIGHARAPEEWPGIAARLEAIAGLAGELRLCTALGYEAWEDGAWHNRLDAYTAAGALAARYDKVHLTGPDTKFYRPGTRQVTFSLNGITVGLQICYDARFPEGYRALLAQGVQVILQGFYGAGGDTWKVPVLSAHLRSRAAESGCFLVAANVAGPLQIVTSQIVDPLGLLLAQANQDCEELISATLDLRRIEDSEVRRDYLARFRQAVSS
jgi:predicted amidohydrolase